MQNNQLAVFLLSLCAALPVTNCEASPISQLNWQRVGLSSVGALILGDIDGDGTPEALVNYRSIQVHGEFFGTVAALSGKTGEVVWETASPISGAVNFGYPLERISDVDGDGIRDVLTTSLNDYNGRASGAGYVLSGRTGKIIRKMARVYYGPENAAAIADAGDLDHDGVHDIAMGSSSNSPVYIYSGRTGELIRYLWLSDFQIGFGSSIAGIGDVDGDRVPDLAIGAQFASDLSSTPERYFVGKVYVISGKTGEIIWEHFGESLQEEDLGASMASVGDVDGDGITDLISGAPRFNGEAGTQTGKVYVFSGASGHVIWSQEGPYPLMNFGWSVRGGSVDANCDNTPDALVGTLSHPVVNSPSVFLFSGRDGAPLHIWNEESRYSGLGYSTDLIGVVTQRSSGKQVKVFTTAPFYSSSTGYGKISYYTLICRN